MPRLREVLPSGGVEDDLLGRAAGTAGGNLQVRAMCGETWIVRAAARHKAGMLVREPDA